jgi:hypothetical protein
MQPMEIFHWQVQCIWKYLSANYASHGNSSLASTLQMEIFVCQLHSLCKYFTGRYTAFGKEKKEIIFPKLQSGWLAEYQHKILYVSTTSCK